ncbi:MAG: hypothetical protein ACLP9L_11160 [Thermoguttaceae bacterium]
MSLTGDGLSSFARSEPAARVLSDAQPGETQPSVPDGDNSQPEAAHEPDKSVSPSIIVSKGDTSSDPAATPAKPLSLADLIHAVNQVGGRLVRQGDAVAVDAGGKSLPIEVEAALAIHQEVLAQTACWSVVLRRSLEMMVNMMIKRAFVRGADRKAHGWPPFFSSGDRFQPGV